MEAVKCLRPEEVVEQGPRFMAGHADELAAAINLARWIRDRKTHLPILSFGRPGTAKTLFPSVLAYHLNLEKIKTGLAIVRCHQLVAEYSLDAVIQRLDVAESFVRTTEFLSIIMFDEVDALAPSRADNPGLARLTTWAMRFLESYDGNQPRLIFGLTNNPENVDAAVRDRFPGSLYFALPEKDTVSTILKHENVPDAERVTERLWTLLDQEKARVSARNIVGAIMLARNFFEADSKPMDQRSCDEILNFIRAHVGTATRDEVSNWELKFQPEIKKSRQFVQVWKQLNKGKA